MKNSKAKREKERRGKSRHETDARERGGGVEWRWERGWGKAESRHVREKKKWKLWQVRRDVFIMMGCWTPLKSVTNYFMFVNECVQCSTSVCAESGCCFEMLPLF